MIRFFNFLLALLFFIPVFSQALLTNNGAMITIRGGTTLFVNGSIENKIGSTLRTTGEVRVTGDMINNGTMNGLGTLYFWGSNQQDLNLNGASIDNLQINKSGSSVSLLSDLTVSTNVDLSLGASSFLLIGNNNLTLGSANITSPSAAGFVVTDGTGKLIRNVGNTAKAFPIGSSVSNYTPATLTNSGTSDNIGLRVMDSVYSAYDGNGVPTGNALNPNREVNKTWILNEATAGGSNLALSLTWNVADQGASFDKNNSAIAFFSGGGWQTNTNGGAASGSSPYTRSRSGLTHTLSNSPLGVGGHALSPLPIAMLQFDVVKKGKDALLTWVTASETKSSHFNVQRSLDGIEYTQIATLVAAGSSSTARDYTYIDANIEAFANSYRIIYYRVQSVDQLEISSLTAAKSINLGNASNKPIVSLFPNPSIGKSLLLFNSLGQQNISISISDATGRVIRIQNVALDGQPKQFELDGSNLAKGIYFLQVGTAGEHQVLRWVRE